MELSKALLIIIILLHFAILTNITLFDGQWNGILMAFSTILFVAAMFFYFANRKSGEKNV